VRAKSNFKNAFDRALTVTGAFAGILYWTSPAKVTFDLPADVAQDVAHEGDPEIRTLWKLGDALIEPASLGMS
jgi:hypothetical protein